MKVFIIGDSISIHYGPYLEKYLAEIAEYARKDGTIEALKNLDFPQGANGGDSQLVLEYLQARASKQPIVADYILINCGLHDIKTDAITGSKQIPIVEYKANLKEIIAETKKAGLKLVWIRTTLADEEVHNAVAKTFLRFKADCIEYNEVADAVMAEADVPTIDLYSFTNNLSDDVYCDHVHFHEHIREKQAAFIAGYINSMINV